ncbi:MAG TPA: biotin/lipoyl-containing protein [Kofleriaceae bacterium]|jgi:acetyl-CoA carboxylase biotin carboxyl carrier protein
MKVAAIADGLVLRAPKPGVFRPRNARIVPGAVVGELVVLGSTWLVIAPPGSASGVAADDAAGPRAVGYGDALVTIDTAAGGAVAAAAPVAAAAAGLVFRAPTSGRFYTRPTPDKPAFVEAGTELTAGATVCLLEVMKTFHRVTYGGADVPARARVVAVLVADGADVNAGDALLSLST